MARLTAVEDALRVLEHEVRDVERQPSCRLARTIGPSFHRPPDDHRIPEPVIEVAA